MKEKTILYTNVDQQIQSLKAQHLIIENEELAKSNLSLFGYSNLIKSYREPYTIISDGKKIFRSGVSFEQICSLYILDKNLRNAVMAAMLDFEEHIKEAAADVVAVSFGVHQDEYLQYRNYQNKRKRQYRFTLPGILDKMKETLDTDKNPIHHYKTEHGIVPPWILFKSVYFSTIVNFIDLFKANEQKAMISHLYDTDKIDMPEDKLPILMMDTLFSCHHYRNRAAHGGRIYNYICDMDFRSSEYIKYSVHGFSQILILLSFLKYKRPYEYLSHSLQREINRHCSDFPSDVTYLGQTLNINIEMTQFVYVSNMSKKFHCDKHCSGIHDAKTIELSEAQKRGYEPCKRCCK